MSNIVIFCKSYRDDLDRAAALVKSIRQFNRDKLPLYLCVPESDLTLFKNKIGIADVHWLCDEEIIAANPAIGMAAYKSLPGHLSQQIVKAEFWRLNPLENCVCVDSDSRFIRDFYAHDFVSPDGTPFTIMHEGKSFAHFCLTHNLKKANDNFKKYQVSFRTYFGRQGINYNFGPFPVIWNSKVWRDLESRHLVPNCINILDAICKLPSEGFWYGEALLKFQSVTLLPREPIFKAYLYFEEYEEDERAGSNEHILAENYLGIVYQSNWYPKRLQLFSRVAYKLKTTFRKLR